MVLVNTAMQDIRNITQTRPRTDGPVLPFSLINLLKCTPSRPESKFLPSTAPLLNNYNLSSLSHHLNLSPLRNSFTLGHFDPLTQLAALRLLQESRQQQQLRNSIAVPVPLRVQPYTRPIRRTTPTPPSQDMPSPSSRHSSSETDSLSVMGSVSSPGQEDVFSPSKTSAFQHVSSSIEVSPENNFSLKDLSSLYRSELEDPLLGNRNILQELQSGEKNSHKCKYCYKTFPSPSHLLIHLRTHSGERPYPCPGCGKTFATRGHLRRHYRIHTGVKPYKCQVCDKAFANQGNLKTHTRLHTGEKPYKCPRCDKAFADAGNLQRHITTHTGVKPYKCVHCNKAFSRSSNLKTHLLTHTGMKPFSCTCCNKSFTRLSYLKAHMKDRTSSPDDEATQSMVMTSQSSILSALQGAGTSSSEQAFRLLNPYSVRVG